MISRSRKTKEGSEEKWLKVSSWEVKVSWGNLFRVRVFMSFQTRHGWNHWRRGFGDIEASLGAAELIQWSKVDTYSDLRDIM